MQKISDKYYEKKLDKEKFNLLCIQQVDEKNVDPELSDLYIPKAAGRSRPKN